MTGDDPRATKSSDQDAQTRQLALPDLSAQFGIQDRPYQGMALVYAYAPGGPVREGRRVKRLRPGKFRQGARFVCLYCGLSVETRKTLEHIQQECAPNIRRRREREAGDGVMRGGLGRVEA